MKISIPVRTTFECNEIANVKLNKMKPITPTTFSRAVLQGVLEHFKSSGKGEITLIRDPETKRAVSRDSFNLTGVRQIALFRLFLSHQAHAYLDTLSLFTSKHVVTIFF